MWISFYCFQVLQSPHDFPWSNMLHHDMSSVFYFPFQFHFDTCC
jgi:hypothetical protein